VDLESVTLLIDTSYQSLLDLGDLVPNLSKLFIDNSKLLTVRDLGTGLRSLQVLSVNNCGLSELDGIAMLANLKYLFARDNLISDINALAMHETLEVKLVGSLPLILRRSSTYTEIKSPISPLGIHSQLART
jgi:Leucine-rich repeat (LRR) protein